MTNIAVDVPILAFVHIEKTAGITVNRMLRRAFGTEHCDLERWSTDDECFSANDYRKLRWFYPRLRSLAGHWVRPYSDLETVFPDIRYFTFLRQPLERCASHYQYQVQIMKRTQSFQEWIDLERYHNFQVRHIAGTEDLSAAIEILRNKLVFTGLVERFAESLIMLRRRVAPTHPLDIRLSHRNIAPSNHIKRALLSDQRSLAAIRRANALDLELYEYVSGELYPRQVQDHGAKALSQDLHDHAIATTPSLFNAKYVAGTLKRNLLYKPYVRYQRRSSGRGDKTA